MNNQIQKIMALITLVVMAIWMLCYQSIDNKLVINKTENQGAHEGFSYNDFDICEFSHPEIFDERESLDWVYMGLSKIPILGSAFNFYSTSFIIGGNELCSIRDGQQCETENDVDVDPGLTPPLFAKFDKIMKIAKTGWTMKGMSFNQVKSGHNTTCRCRAWNGRDYSLFSCDSRNAVIKRYGYSWIYKIPYGKTFLSLGTKHQMSYWKIDKFRDETSWEYKHYLEPYWKNIKKMGDPCMRENWGEYKTKVHVDVDEVLKAMTELCLTYKWASLKINDPWKKWDELIMNGSMESIFN